MPSDTPPLRHDLHSHSRASDGTLSPAELVQRAHAAGVQVLALTDHDETSGIAEAQAAASACGLLLVPGVEISVTWGAMTIHVVGLHIDPEAPLLLEGLAQLRNFRDWRAAEIGRRLAKHGISGAYEGALRYASGRIVSRTHFAQFLAAAGHAENTREVFKHFLRRNKPGHVPGQWATLEQAVGWIRGAGGMAVVAHPARYDLTATRRRKLLGEFVELGGEGIEVVSGSHSRDDCIATAQYAQKFKLLTSVGSDYHGPENPWLELGRLPPLPDNATQPIWESERWASVSAPSMSSTAVQGAA
ncbi:MAG TPA: PHP domain-containing protein [Gammaproteobacteria bacterium]